MLVVIFAMLNLKVLIDLRGVKVIRSDQGDVKRKNAFLLSSFKLYINLESRRQWGESPREIQTITCFRGHCTGLNTFGRSIYLESYIATDGNIDIIKASKPLAWFESSMILYCLSDTFYISLFEPSLNHDQYLHSRPHLAPPW